MRAPRPNLRRPNLRRPNLRRPNLRRPNLRRVGWTLAGAGLVLVGLADMAPASQAAAVTTQLGSLTVSASALRPGPAGTLSANVQVSTSGQPSDQLDAAIAAGGLPVAVYHQRVAVGELTDLASCDGDSVPPALANQWLHYGPLLVPGRSGGPAAPAEATLTVQRTAARFLAITLYFAHAGSVTLRLPVTARLASGLLRALRPICLASTTCPAAGQPPKHVASQRRGPEGALPRQGPAPRAT